jgi:pimeloyl-ACP methyl ester carboxylesterase
MESMPISSTVESVESPVAASPAQWKEMGESVSLNGHQLFVIEGGRAEAPTLLLIHGFPTSSWDWAPMWPVLTQHFRVIAMDMLGFGYSDKPNLRNYTIHGQADLVEAVVKHKQLQRFHVLAHDYGDTVAQELLSRQDEGVGAGNWLSCCFLNGGLFPETHRALLTQKLLLSPIGAWVNKLSGFAQFKKSFSSVFGEKTKPTEAELHAYWQIINTHGGKHIFHNLMTYIRDRKLHRQRWVKALQDSTRPLALINGAVDPVSGAHLVARYQELNCRLDYLAQLDDIGHYPQVEAPERVAAHYLSFVQQVSDAEKAVV